MMLVSRRLVASKVASMALVSAELAREAVTMALVSRRLASKVASMALISIELTREAVTMALVSRAGLHCFAWRIKSITRSER